MEFPVPKTHPSKLLNIVQTQIGEIDNFWPDPECNISYIKVEFQNLPRKSILHEGFALHSTVGNAKGFLDGQNNFTPPFTVDFSGL